MRIDETEPDQAKLIELYCQAHREIHSAGMYLAGYHDPIDLVPSPGVYLGLAYQALEDALVTVEEMLEFYPKNVDLKQMKKRPCHCCNRETTKVNAQI